MKFFEVELTFTEPLLGTVPKNKEIYQKFIQKKVDKAKDVKDELGTVEEELERNWTGFHKLDGNPVIYDYVIKGFLKDACSMLRRDTKSRSHKIPAFKKVIDGLIFVYPRRIPVDLCGGEIGVLERPLRGQTAKGERIALTCSDTCPVGSKLKFKLQVLSSVTRLNLKEWFEYGKLRGLGQWRNGSYGRFDYTITAIDGKKRLLNP